MNILLPNDDTLDPKLTDAFKKHVWDELTYVKALYKKINLILMMLLKEIIIITNTSWF